jgi:hypothetical protein
LPGRATSHRLPAFSMNRSAAQCPTPVLSVPFTLVWSLGPGLVVHGRVITRAAMVTCVRRGPPAITTGLPHDFDVCPRCGALIASRAGAKGALKNNLFNFSGEELACSSTLHEKDVVSIGGDAVARRSL